MAARFLRDHSHCQNEQEKPQVKGGDRDIVPAAFD
jgi:hypothetical protein